MYIKKIINKVRDMKRGLFLKPAPGHYYSPIVDKVDITQRADSIFSLNPKQLMGIDLNESHQLLLLSEFEQFYHEIPFTHQQSIGRYYYNNSFYAQSDAVFLYSMIRHFKPHKIIEIGSGFSSAVILDTVESLNRNDVSFTCIEPYPKRLKTLLKPSDNNKCKIIESNLQYVHIELFKELQANDILFVDSTHVSKTGSDVNKIFFEILPILNSGVLIHFHDIFYPFEYPKEWVLGWRSFGWNENYMLRSFLMYNLNYEIVMFNTYLERNYRDRFKEKMPICLENEGGSIWIRKK